MKQVILGFLLFATLAVADVFVVSVQPTSLAAADTNQQLLVRLQQDGSWANGASLNLTASSDVFATNGAPVTISLLGFAEGCIATGNVLNARLLQVTVSNCVNATTNANVSMIIYNGLAPNPTAGSTVQLIATFSGSTNAYSGSYMIQNGRSIHWIQVYPSTTAAGETPSSLNFQFIPSSDLNNGDVITIRANQNVFVAGANPTPSGFGNCQSSSTTTATVITITLSACTNVLPRGSPILVTVNSGLTANAANGGGLVIWTISSNKDIVPAVTTPPQSYASGQLIWAAAVPSTIQPGVVPSSYTFEFQNSRALGNGPINISASIPVFIAGANPTPVLFGFGAGCMATSTTTATTIHINLMGCTAEAAAGSSLGIRINSGLAANPVSGTLLTFTAATSSDRSPSLSGAATSTTFGTSNFRFSPVILGGATAGTTPAYLTIPFTNFNPLNNGDVLTITSNANVFIPGANPIPELSGFSWGDFGSGCSATSTTTANTLQVTLNGCQLPVPLANQLAITLRSGLAQNPAINTAVGFTLSNNGNGVSTTSAAEGYTIPGLMCTAEGPSVVCGGVRYIANNDQGCQGRFVTFNNY